MKRNKNDNKEKSQQKGIETTQKKNKAKGNTQIIIHEWIKKLLKKQMTKTTITTKEEKKE